MADKDNEQAAGARRRWAEKESKIVGNNLAMECKQIV
jgi:hypothetical protein